MSEAVLTGNLAVPRPFTVEQMLKLRQDIDLQIIAQPEVIQRFAEVVVDEVTSELAFAMVDRIGFDWPENGEFSLHDVIDFLGKAELFPIGTDQEPMLLRQAFNNSSRLLMQFLLKGLEVLVTEKADEDEDPEASRDHNQKILQEAAQLTKVSYSPLDEAQIRLILSRHHHVRAITTPHSTPAEETHRWLDDLVTQALQHPLIQALIFSGDVRWYPTLLPQLGVTLGGKSETEYPVEVQGTHLNRTLLTRAEVREVNEFLGGNPEIALGLLILFLEEKTAQYLYQAITALWVDITPALPNQILKQLDLLDNDDEDLSGS